VIHHGDTEARSKLLHEELTEKIIGAAIEVHRALCLGLLESAYEVCLCREFNLRGLVFQRQVPLPVEYKGVKLDCGYRLDLVVQDAVILELKCEEHVLPVHRGAIPYVSQTNREARRHHHELQRCNAGKGWHSKKGFVNRSALLRVFVSLW
jgi:GxxExxY protein